MRQFLAYYLSTGRHVPHAKNAAIRSPLPVRKRARWSATIRDPRVAESMRVARLHLHARGRKVLAESDSTVDFGATQRRAPAVRRRWLPQADLVVAIGGDGTLLYAARLVAPHDVPLLGINRGRLGFLADVGPQDMSRPLDAILEGRYEQRRARDAAARR